MRTRTRVLLLAIIVVLLLAGPAGLFLYRRGFVQLNYPRAGRYPVRGIDVSHHQHEIEWAKLGVDFAFIKSSEGATRRDRLFKRNWRASDGLLARSAYHFFTFCTPGRAQASNFLEAAPEPGELPRAIDIEFAGNCVSWTSIDDVRAELRAFLAALRAADDREPILYVTRDSHARLIAGHFDEYPLWLRDVVRHPSPSEFPTMRFWQYAGNGRMDGVDGLVDLNVFVGDRAAFKRLVR